MRHRGPPRVGVLVTDETARGEGDPAHMRARLAEIVTCVALVELPCLEPRERRLGACFVERVLSLAEHGVELARAHARVEDPLARLAHRPRGADLVRRDGLRDRGRLAERHAPGEPPRKPTSSPRSAYLTASDTQPASSGGAGEREREGQDGRARAAKNRA